MKHIIGVFILLSFLGCTSNDRSSRPSYEVINEIWTKQGTIQDLEKMLGRPDIVDNEKSEYLYPNSRVPQMHFEFSKNGKLESALLFLEEGKLAEFKSFLKCQWLETKGQKQIADAIYLTHEGHCKDVQVRFNYFSSLRSYEIWWDSKVRK